MIKNKNMENFDIKVTGNGTKEEIISALKTLINSIEENVGECHEMSFEDSTLYTEIWSTQL